MKSITEILEAVEAAEWIKRQVAEAAVGMPRMDGHSARAYAVHRRDIAKKTAGELAHDPIRRGWSSDEARCWHEIAKAYGYRPTLTAEDVADMLPTPDDPYRWGEIRGDEVSGAYQVELTPRHATGHTFATLYVNMNVSRFVTFDSGGMRNGTGAGFTSTEAVQKVAGRHEQVARAFPQFAPVTATEEGAYR